MRSGLTAAKFPPTITTLEESMAIGNGQIGPEIGPLGFSRIVAGHQHRQTVNG